MYADLASFGVRRGDIRDYNILRAPASDSSPLPSIPSPFTLRKYNWRIVDFDRACKAHRCADLFAERIGLERLLSNPPGRYTWEP